MNPVIEAPTRLPTFAAEHPWVLLTAISVFALLTLRITIDAAGHLSEVFHNRRNPHCKGDGRPHPTWEVMYELAERVVEETITALPNEIRAEATKLPCLYRERAKELHGRDALGVYHGFEPGFVAEPGGFIVLFLDDLQRYCAEYDLDFEEEIRITYLHELGHHLGWDEEDLESRGL